MKKQLLVVAVSLLLVATSGHAKPQASTEVAANVITILNPQAKLDRHYPDSGEIFMDIINKGSTQHELIAAVTPVAKEVQLHQTTIRNHRSLMQPVKQFKISPHHDKDLQQGGLHIMLVNLNKILNVGDTIPLTLVFNDGSYQQLTVPVEQPIS